MSLIERQGRTGRAGIMACRGAVEGLRAGLVIYGISCTALLPLSCADAQTAALMTHLCSWAGRYKRPGEMQQSIFFQAGNEVIRPDCQQLRFCCKGSYLSDTSELVFPAS